MQMIKPPTGPNDPRPAINTPRVRASIRKARSFVVPPQDDSVWVSFRRNNIFGRGSTPLGMLLLLMTIMSFGCGGPEKQLVFRYQIAAQANALDPALVTETYSDGIVDRIFEGLMCLDRVRGIPVPALAGDVRVDEDGLVYTFVLRSDARFHHGRQVLASDVKRSWERVLDPATGSPSSWMLDAVEGADLFRSGAADSVSGIEIADPSLVRVRLAEPLAAFLYNLAQTGTAVVPMEEVERLGSSFARRPIGSGPFRFVEREPNRVILAGFAQHYGGAPAVDRLEFVTVSNPRQALREYQTGHLDLVSEIPAGSLGVLKQSFPGDLRVFPSMTWRGVCFRCDQPPFDQLQLRQAISLAVDRQALVSELGAAQFTELGGLLPQTVPGHDPGRLTESYDPERARELLSGLGSLPVLHFSTRSNELDQRFAEIVAADLSAVGLEVEIEALPTSQQIRAFERGEASFFRYGWVGEYPDPEAFLRPLFWSGSDSNVSRYSSAVTDSLLERARLAATERDRIRLYLEAESQILVDAPCVPLYQPSEAILIQSRWAGVPIGYKRTHLEIELATLVKGR